MKTYLRVYRKFVETSLAAAMSFRISFVLIIIMDLIFYATSYFTVDFIYDHVNLIGSWKREQLLFFLSFMLCLDNLHMIVISENFWVFNYIVRTGEMDFVLLRPLNSIFSVFFRHFRAASLVNVPLAHGMLYYFAYQLELPWTSIIMIPFLLILSFFLLVSLEIIISTATFWMTEGYGINFLRMQMQKMSRWPHFVYHGLWKIMFLWCFPVLLVGSAPSSVVYNENSLAWLAALVGALIVSMFVMLKIWSIGVKNYESASS